MYSTETGASDRLFSPAGAGEEGNASPADDVTCCVLASSATLKPLLLSVDAFSSLPTQTTSSLVFTQLLCSFYVTLSFSLSTCSPPSHVAFSLAPGAKDVGAANGGAGGGAKGEKMLRTNLIMLTDTLHASARLAWL